MKISFIGGGNMATALIAGLADKLTPGPSIHVVDPNPAARDALRARYGVTSSDRIEAQVSISELIVLAVKPQQMHDVACALRPMLVESRPLIVSIAAGIRAGDLARWLGGYDAIVRTMPNTPALIGKGVTGMVALAGVRAAQRELADAVMRVVGATVWLASEALIDPVTAVSGSGPAYVFYFIEAMQQGAVEMGLSPEQGRELALATFLGAAELAVQSPEPVSVLRERVTSKGGTTYAALCSMGAGGVKEAIIAAMKAAAQRSVELGDAFGALD